MSPIPHFAQATGTPTARRARRRTAPGVRPAPRGRRVSTAAGSRRVPVADEPVSRRWKCAVSVPWRAMARWSLRRFGSPTGRPSRRIMAASDRDAAAAALTSLSLSSTRR
ncbi:hypothetical protein [Nonomuraea maheshkhaliensis]|uniref:hypothetical protein n=1 Tax=Nonomuraea maheshkhaliensis TaxID=419590 RepID=UPI0031FA0D62